MSHTPTPWRVSEICTLWGKNEEYIGDIADSIDAAHIVHCVNAHAALVEALNHLVREPMSERAVDRAKKALAQVEKGA